MFLSNVLEQGGYRDEERILTLSQTSRSPTDLTYCRSTLHPKPYISACIPEDAEDITDNLYM